MSDTTEQSSIQHAYYARTAGHYDTKHECEHRVALYFLCAIVEMADMKSVLDFGAGTG